MKAVLKTFSLNAETVQLTVQLLRILQMLSA